MVCAFQKPTNCLPFVNCAYTICRVNRTAAAVASIIMSYLPYLLSRKSHTKLVYGTEIALAEFNFLGTLHLDKLVRFLLFASAKPYFITSYLVCFLAAALKVFNGFNLYSYNKVTP